MIPGQGQGTRNGACKILMDRRCHPHHRVFRFIRGSWCCTQVVVFCSNDWEAHCMQTGVELSVIIIFPKKNRD